MMTAEKAITLLQNEKACVETDACDHDCGACSLAGDQKEIVEALDMAIRALDTHRCADCTHYRPIIRERGWCGWHDDGTRVDDTCSRWKEKKNEAVDTGDQRVD